VVAGFIKEASPMSDLLKLAILRRVLADHRDLAAVMLEDLMLKYGATDEELEREAAFWRGVWEDQHERQLRDIEAWLGRGGQALQ
jgi:hypothetical protein